jgi:hypothetical protein
VKALALLLACLLPFGVAAQEPAKKKKKPAAAKAVAHKKPTAEQIRKFNELEKKKKQ